MSQDEKEIYEKINLYYDIAEKLKYNILQLEDITEEERNMARLYLNNMDTTWQSIEPLPQA